MKETEVGCQDHFLDSGAFTLWGKAAKFAQENGCTPWDYYFNKEKGAFTRRFTKYLDAYAEFIYENKIAIDLYANVDVIPNADLTWMSQQYLENTHGLTPVPVVHYKTPLKWLQHYIDRGYEIVGLGGLVGSTSQEQCQQWIDKCFDLVCSTPKRLPKVKIHGFGLTSIYLMARYPWYCMTKEDHEVLTKEGWKGVDSLKVGEEILCYDLGEAKWQKVLEIPQFPVLNADLVHLRNKKIKGVDAKVSWNHRWLVSDRDNPGKFRWRETHDLRNTDTIPRVGNYVDAPTKETYSDEFVELVAWYWTEGSLKDPTVKHPNRKKTAVIYQSEGANPEKCKRIRDCLLALGERFCETKTVNKRHNNQVEIQFNLYGDTCKKLLELIPTKEKIIPYHFILSLTKQQLELFIDTSVSGDGHRKQMIASENFDASLRQKDRRNIDQFRVACILAGYTTSETTSKEGVPEVRLCRTEHTEFAWCKVMEKDVFRYSGTLWCVRVPSGAFFVRSNGCVYVTGNSIDSASWTKIAAYGGVIVPHLKGGKWVFKYKDNLFPQPHEIPYVMKVSKESPERKKKGHYENLGNEEKEVLNKWLKEINVPLRNICDEDGEILETGVIDHHTARRVANIRFFDRMLAALPKYPWPFTSTRRKGFGLMW